MRASGASELEHFHNYIHLPMQFHNAMFYFKNGTFWVWKFWECKRPRPPDSTALDCAPSGAMRKVHGDNFPVPPSL